MRNLIQFLIRYFSWLVFAFYVVLSCIFLFGNNSYQNHTYLTSANVISSNVYGVVNNITSYFNLRDINSDLQVSNALLEKDVLNLKQQLQVMRTMHYADTVKTDSVYNNFDFIVAEVINNSVSRPFNYITINKGSKDGIKPEMGIVDQNGVVGIVNVVSDHASRVISLLNPKFRLSCKVKGSNSFGSLLWDGGDANHAMLEEMPKHIKYKVGDTIITSGYSSVFPEGIIVGIIEKLQKTKNDNSVSLKIKLSTDFYQLSTVRAISNSMSEEITKVENAEVK